MNRAENAVVRKLRARLLKFGWTKGSYGWTSGACCVTGGASYAFYGMRPTCLPTAVFERLQMFLGEVFGSENVFDFNDHPDTHLSDVIGLLDSWLCAEEG